MEEISYRNTVFELIHWLLKNDNVTRDRTSSFIPDREIKGTIISKQDAVIAGLEEVAYLLKKKTNLEFEIIINDGEQAEKGQTVAAITGNSRDIVAMERTILNILQRMSGIATQTRRLVDVIGSQETFIAATRKTPWGLLDKKAVAVGGGLTHRLSLADGVLIKDNHLEIIKKNFGIINEQEAVKKAMELILPELRDSMIEIETNTQEGAQQAIQSFTTSKNSNYLTVMLDNWSPGEAGKFIKEMTKQADISQILFEASGNITEKNIAGWEKTGVTMISLGALTHSVKAVDLSLEITEV